MMWYNLKHKKYMEFDKKHSSDFLSPKEYRRKIEKADPRNTEDAFDITQNGVKIHRLYDVPSPIRSKYKTFNPLIKDEKDKTLHTPNIYVPFLDPIPKTLVSSVHDKLRWEWKWSWLQKGELRIKWDNRELHGEEESKPVEMAKPLLKYPETNRSWLLSDFYKSLEGHDDFSNYDFTSLHPRCNKCRSMDCRRASCGIENPFENLDLSWYWDWSGKLKAYMKSHKGRLPKKYRSTYWKLRGKSIATDYNWRMGFNKSDNPFTKHAAQYKHCNPCECHYVKDCMNLDTAIIFVKQHTDLKPALVPHCCKEELLNWKNMKASIKGASRFFESLEMITYHLNEYKTGKEIKRDNCKRIKRLTAKYDPKSTSEIVVEEMDTFTSSPTVRVYKTNRGDKQIEQKCTKVVRHTRPLTSRHQALPKILKPDLTPSFNIWKHKVHGTWDTIPKLQKRVRVLEAATELHKMGYCEDYMMAHFIGDLYGISTKTVGHKLPQEYKDTWKNRRRANLHS